MDTLVKFNFNQALETHNCLPFKRDKLTELQVNLGYLCNQACEHCHVEAGPKRTELMTAETMKKIVQWAKENGIQRADLTGGAPELNPSFREFVDHLIDIGISITARCNLTVLHEPGQEDLAQWYAERKVRLVCSLPCYTPENVNKQRGKGVFGKSIEALQTLNALGYGIEDGMQIDLVYNPIGPHLPPSQSSLMDDYKTRLFDDFKIRFNQLLTITNLPIKRFEHFLTRTGQLEGYLQLLSDNFNPDTVAPLMCRHTISVDWMGYVYDCDFNQMLELPMAASGREQLWNINPEQMQDAPIAVGKHCFGCTAGAGSSCGGSLA